MSTLFRKASLVICSVAGLLIVSQFPAFLDQYYQQLAARLDEIDRGMINLLDQSESLGMRPRELLNKLQEESSGTTLELLRDIEDQLDRLEDRAQAYKSLGDANVYERPFVFFRDLNSDVAGNTLQHFQPAVPTSMEGAVYALIGAFLGCGVHFALWRRGQSQTKAQTSRSDRNSIES